MIPRAALRWLEWLLPLVGLVLLGVWFKTDSESRAFQAEASKRLEASLRESELIGPPLLHPAPRPRPPRALEQGGLGRLQIPPPRISAIVAPGTGGGVPQR